MAFIKQIKVGTNTYDIHKKVTVTIAAADWTATTIDKTVSGMTVNDIVVVSPAPSSLIGARNSVVYCSAIKANALSFTYNVSKPSTSLTFTVLWVQAATTDTDKGAIINTVMGGKIPTGTLNISSTLSNYDTYLNNIRYINLGAGTLNTTGSAISSVSGSGSVNPGANTISKNSTTNVSTGTVTTTKPTSGVYVAVDAATAQNSGSININASGTAKAGVTTAGYVKSDTTASNTISKSGTASVTVPAKSASTTYIPISAGTIDVTDKTVTPNALSGKWDATNKKYVVSQASKTDTVQSTVSTEGYVSSSVGTKNTGTITISAPTNLEIAQATFTASGKDIKSSTAGYIPADTTVGSASTVTRAKTTTSTAADTTNAKLTVTASNNQGTGYVTGSNETASDTITLSVSGATVTATSSNDNTKKVSSSVATGTAGTPIATKGTVSNHSIAVTPSVTNTTGYITGGTKSGTAVTVAASELVSGNRALSSSASDQTNIDVTNYKTVSISKMNSTNVVEKAGSINTTNNTYTQGKVTVDAAGYISAGDKVSGASFANTATKDITYTDISSTTAAPILVSNDYLYINKGYTDNVKISLAKLVPDGASADLASNKILSGYSAYNNDGKLIAGSIPTVTPAFDGGALSGNNISGSQTKGSVTISESGTFFADAAKTNFGVTTTKPTSGTDGTNYLTVHEEHSITSDTATGSTTITRGAVLYNGAVNGYVSKADNTQALAAGGDKTVSASITVTPSVKDNFEPYYIPIVTPTFDGGTLSITNSTTDTGALSGGALAAGTGEVSITTTPVVTPSVSGTAVSSTSQTNFGVTTTKPSGTDGTNYITLDPSGSVTTTGKTKGRGSVTRGTINRAKFSSTVNRGAVLYNGAQHGAINIADNAQALASGSTTVSLAAGSIASTSGTSNWSAESNITPTIAAGTNYYIPVSTASATAGAGTATATAGTTSTSGLTTGTYQTTATSGYTYSITATGGSASATGGSASASVSKGVTAGATKTASGAATGTKTGSSSTIYLVKATITNNTSGGTSSGTIGVGKQIKIGAGYNPSDLYYTAQTSAAGASGNVTCNAQSGNSVAGYATASVKTGSATTPATTISHAVSVKWDDTKGWIATAPATTKSVTPTVAAGWVASGTAGTITLPETSVSLGSSAWSSATAPSGTTPTTLAKGTTYKMTAGYSNVDRYYTTQSDPTLGGNATAADVLSDKTFYSNSYTKQTGSMTNNGTISKNIGYGESYTVPKGYHSGSGKVTNGVGAGTVKSGTVSIGALSAAYNSTAGNFTISATATAAAPTVSTAGYVSSSVGTKSSNSNSISSTLAKIGLGASISGTKTTTPVISRQTKPTDDTWIDAASGAATTTKPTSDVYVKVKSAANTGTLTASSSVSSAGYGDKTNYSSTAATATVGANASADTYIPITTTSASKSGSKVSWGSGWITEGSQTVGRSDLGITDKAAATYNVSSSDQTISSGYYLTGTQTIKAVKTANISAANIKSDVTVTVGDEGSASRIASVKGTYTSSLTSGQTGITAAQVLSGYSGYYNGSAEIKGTMTNRGAVNPTALNPGGSYTIPAGYHNGSGKVSARALVNQAKSPTAITVAEAITPDSGKDGLSSVTIPSGATITVHMSNKLNINVPAMSSPVVTYTSAENEGGTDTQLNATVGGASANTINLQNMATVTANLSSANSTLKINRTSGTVISDDLIASNIRKGSSILGVAGTYSASSTASDIYRANYAGNVSSGWSTYWESYEGTILTDSVFYDLPTPIIQGASVRLIYNEFGYLSGGSSTSGAGFGVYLVSESGQEQLIFSPSAAQAANGPHTSSAVTASFKAVGIKVTRVSAGGGETVSTYQTLVVESQIAVPSGYYGIAIASNGTTLADISSYQYLAVKKATLGNTYTPKTTSQTVYAKGEGWVKTSDSIATISAIPTETKSVALSMASGNQTISATSDKYMTSVTVTKPSTLIASNIKSGVNIAGVTGTYTAPAATINSQVVGLFNFTVGGGSNLENVGGKQFSTTNRIFGNEGTYVGCFVMIVFKGEPTTKPMLIGPSGTIYGESYCRTLDDFSASDSDRDQNLYNSLNALYTYYKNIGYTKCYLAPVQPNTTPTYWNTTNYYWQYAASGDSGLTTLYIKNFGAQAVSTSYDD